MKRLALVFALIAAAACTPKPQVAVVAHRGYWNCEEAGFTRNSIASLRCAQEAGFWGSEFDVQLTGDDSLIVFHDGHLGEISITESPYSAIADHVLNNGEKIPFLDEYLEQGAKCTTTKLIFEIKETPNHERNILLTDLSIEALKRHGLFDPSRVVFISFCQDICEYLGENYPEFMTELLFQAYETPEAYVEKGINGVDLYFQDFQTDTTLCARSKDAGLKVNTWTVNDVETIKQLAVMGVDEITTDIPVDAREALAELGIKENRL